MRILYNLLIKIAALHLQITQFFSKKLKLFVSGRKSVYTTLNKQIAATDKTVWFHCASLGEFEQGLPIMEAFKNKYPDFKIVVSFFSPSGYEIKRNTPIADAVVYLPMDTRKNAHKFIAAVHPSIAFFVKYEFWPNYLFELADKKITTLLVSGLFRKKQIFFKSYGSFMRKALRTFNHLFVQDMASEALLKTIAVENTTISGDTRFDRVSHQIEQNNTIELIELYKGDSLCIVCGSTWPEDENVLLEYINSAPDGVKFIIAPHKIDNQKIETFRNQLKGRSTLYSDLKASENASELLDASVLIINNIGLLTKIYSYADIAYVGGAMGNTGLHNILEPATFGVPIVIGNNFNGFPEAKRLQQLAGLFSINSASECSEVLHKLVTNKYFRSKTGMISGHFVNSNTGATKTIMQYIDSLYGDGLI